MQGNAWTFGIGGVVAFMLVALFAWLIKKLFFLAVQLVNGWLEEHKKLVEGTLKTMDSTSKAIDANTMAIGANTEATLRMINGNDVRKALEEEKSKNLEKKVDRIESDVKHIRIHIAGGGGC